MSSVSDRLQVGSYRRHREMVSAITAGVALVEVYELP
jgi:hypothetical protein